jgi:hypothetical protein
MAARHHGTGNARAFDDGLAGRKILLSHAGEDALCKAERKLRLRGRHEMFYH